MSLTMVIPKGYTNEKSMTCTLCEKSDQVLMLRFP